MTEETNQKDMLGLTTEIVSAHVSNNSVSVEDLPKLIREVHASLTRVTKDGGKTEDKPTPAVPIKKSVTPDYLICLEDGKKLKMLKRHLKTVYNMTPDDYREKWGLPADYPMVAPNYAKRRSQLAKEIGLGTRSRNQNTEQSQG